MNLPDIPRLYTALAEWLACIVYLLPLSRRWKGWWFWPAAAGVLVLQGAFLALTDEVPIELWIPCMVGAVCIMFLFLCLTGKLDPAAAGYTCVQAFLLAELAASLEWQLHCFIWPDGRLDWPGLALLAAVYGICFGLMFRLERSYAPDSIHFRATWREVSAALGIGLAAFFLANISFVTDQSPFGSLTGMALLTTRTLVDLAGVAVLYAYHRQQCEQRSRQELDAMEYVLQSQYLQYQQSKESIELINRKYHDLKHQIAALRAAPDAEQRNAYLDEMENEIRSYEAQNKTGSPVLDTILTGKALQCQREGIGLSCVADGSLLDFMDVMDVCTVFGNALDNAIEYEQEVPDREKRLIHVSVFRKSDFLILRFENYCPDTLTFDDGLPVTTKGSLDFHGFGMKSIRQAVVKYGGTMTAQAENGWFELKALIPLPRTASVRTQT